MILMAIDGGGEHSVKDSNRGTGWCVLGVTKDTAPAKVAGGLIVGGPSAFLEHFPDSDSPFEHYMRMSHNIVVENFRLFNANANIDALEIVGMVGMYGRLHRIPVHKQMPRERKAVTHDDLRRIGMWPGGAGHADEAQATLHALVWLMKQGHRPTMELIAPRERADEPTKPARSPRSKRAPAPEVPW